MRFHHSVASVFTVGAALVRAQFSFENSTGRIICAKPGNYCAGNSLQTNYIVRCGDRYGSPGNCNDNLAGLPPVGVKDFAPCYETSPTAGDAQCTYNCILSTYPNGTVVTVPGCTPTSTFTPSPVIPLSTAEPTADGDAGGTGDGAGNGGNNTNSGGTPLYPTKNVTSPTISSSGTPVPKPSTGLVSAATFNVQIAQGLMLALISLATIMVVSG